MFENIWTSSLIISTLILCTLDFNMKLSYKIAHISCTPDFTLILLQRTETQINAVKDQCNIPIQQF
jgi:hypothetical protein